MNDINLISMGISESKELAYWVGVAQSDGHLSKYANNRRVMLGVKKKSLPMLEKFQMLSGILLGKCAKIYKSKSKINNLGSFHSTHSTGIKKYNKILNLFKFINRGEIKTILDGGGTDYTYHFLKTNFPNAKIISLNLNENDMKNVENKIIGNVEKIQKYLKKDSIDMIFFCDTLEHLLFPKKFIEGAKYVIRKNGYILITTPNLASLFNRIFLLLGFSPSNYHATEGPIVGNPLMKDRFGGSHRSVFTFRGLKEWINLNGFKIVKYDGFDYGNEKITYREGRFSKLRKLINFLMPVGCKEGIVVLCKKI